MSGGAATGHTPAFTLGPWSVGGKYAFKTVLLNAYGQSIASGGNNRAVQGAELEASLRLAAAAPDLLYALIRALDAGIGSDGHHSPTPAEEARMAIARATEPQQ